MVFDEENFDTSMIDTQEHWDSCATLYQHHILVHSQGATRPWYYCIFIWYPYVANVVVVVLVLSAYFSFFLDPVHTWASSHLSVPSSTISEVLALHRDKSDPFTRAVWVACMIVLTSFLCFALGPLRDIASTDYLRIRVHCFSRGRYDDRELVRKKISYAYHSVFLAQKLRQNVVVLISMALVTFGIVSLPTSETTTCETAISREASAQQMWHSTPVWLLFLVSVFGGIYGVGHACYSWLAWYRFQPGSELLFVIARLSNLLVCLLEFAGLVFFYRMMRQERHRDEFCHTVTTMNKTDSEYSVYWSAAQRSSRTKQGHCVSCSSGFGSEHLVTSASSSCLYSWTGISCFTLVVAK